MTRLIWVPGLPPSLYVNPWGTRKREGVESRFHAAGAAYSIGGSGNYIVAPDANDEISTGTDIGLGLEMLLEGLPK